MTRRNESMLAWMAFVFGCVLFLSPEVKSFALMAKAAPLWLWGFVFWALGVVGVLGSRIHARKFRIAFSIMGVVAWGAVIAAYVYELMHIHTLYPTQAMAAVCLGHSIQSTVILWRTR